MTQQLQLIDLNALAAPVCRIKIFDQEHDVLPASGRAADLLQQIAEAMKAVQAGGDTPQAAIDSLAMQREIVKEAVPTLDDATLRRMNVVQLNQVIALSTQQQDAVRAFIASREGNAGGP